jgi:hypothetical protein
MRRGDDVASLTCSRYVLEAAARRRLEAAARNVEFRPGARVAGLLRAEPRDGDAPAVTGVALAGGWEPYVRKRMWSPPPALEARL